LKFIHLQLLMAPKVPNTVNAANARQQKSLFCFVGTERSNGEIGYAFGLRVVSDTLYYTVPAAWSPRAALSITGITGITVPMSSCWSKLRLRLPQICSRVHRCSTASRHPTPKPPQQGEDETIVKQTCMVVLAGILINLSHASLAHGCQPISALHLHYPRTSQGIWGLHWGDS